MAKQKLTFNLCLSQIITLIGIVITMTVTVLTYTNSTSAKITALDSKIESKIDSTHYRIDKLNSNMSLIIGFFEEKDEIRRYLTAVQNAKKDIKDTIICPDNPSRIASKNCYTISDVNLEDNYIHAIENDQ